MQKELSPRGVLWINSTVTWLIEIMEEKSKCKTIPSASNKTQKNSQDQKLTPKKILHAKSPSLKYIAERIVLYL